MMWWKVLESSYSVTAYPTTYIHCPTRWSLNGLTPTHHQSGGISGTGGEHTKMAPAHVVLGKREERGDYHNHEPHWTVSNGN